MKDSTNCDIVVAKIISFFSNDYLKAFIINVGTDHGVAVDDVVRNQSGLVGRIVEVAATWSQAILITDSNSNIPVKIGEKQINAILGGDNSNLLRMIMVHEDIAIQNGDAVVTSGFGHIFLDQIPVGTIVEKNKKIFIKPTVDFNSIKYVAVLKNQKI
jgi:rod shape-determining protein MreC